MAKTIRDTIQQNAHVLAAAGDIFQGKLTLCIGEGKVGYHSQRDDDEGHHPCDIRNRRQHTPRALVLFDRGAFHLPTPPSSS